jgi:hypothetical protein
VSLPELLDLRPFAARAATAAAAATRAATARNAAGVPDPRCECLPQGGRVPLGKVDLVRHTVEGKGHRLGAFGVVYVVDEQYLNSLSHCCRSSFVAICA